MDLFLAVVIYNSFLVIQTSRFVAHARSFRYYGFSLSSSIQNPRINTRHMRADRTLSVSLETDPFYEKLADSMEQKPFVMN